MWGQERTWHAAIGCLCPGALKQALHRAPGRQRWSADHRHRSSYFQTLRQLQQARLTLPVWSQLELLSPLSPGQIGSEIFLFLKRVHPFYVYPFVWTKDHPHILKTMWSLNWSGRPRLPISQRWQSVASHVRPIGLNFFFFTFCLFQCLLLGKQPWASFFKSLRFNFFVHELILFVCKSHCVD